jgi:SAM-dependent methyltransferase
MPETVTATVTVTVTAEQRGAPMPGTAEEATGTGAATAGADYARRLARLEFAGWKQRVDVQAPYRWNVQRLNLGRVLDVGCGIGRNLAHLDGNGIGVDHNGDSIAVARQRGLTAYTTEEFHRTEHARSAAFDSLLFAHLAEHVSREVFLDIVRQYLPYLRPNGRVVFICPQEKGYRTDPTHVRFVDFADLLGTCADLDLDVVRQYSFPFPRVAGTVFPYNEFVVVARRP